MDRWMGKEGGEGRREGWRRGNNRCLIGEWMRGWMGR